LRGVTPADPEGDRETLRARLVAALPPHWRTRFAPAPTGHLHLGHAVNAVYVWSLARAFGGRVILRIEDHDAQRARPEFDASIQADLAWLGLTPDNTALDLPSPLRQPADRVAYGEALAHLEATGTVYRCRCSRREIAAQRGPQHPDGWYPGTCRSAQVPASDTVALRVQLDDTIEEFIDLRHGRQSQRPAQQCGDLLIRDRHGQWTYQFAVVVDDIAQGIDVVIRGDDLLDSTGRQLRLRRMLGQDTPPLYLHHALVLRPDGSKLSKSLGDTALHELRAAGASAAAVLGEAAHRAGLQADAQPLEATALARLWDQGAWRGGTAPRAPLDPPSTRG
jgi:glutamyl-Q tRNA(Asp) synthetase